MSFCCMKNIESIIAFRGTPQCKIAKYQMEGEEEITTSQSSASMQVFAAVRDAFRIKNGITWEKFPRGKTPSAPAVKPNQTKNNDTPTIASLGYTGPTYISDWGRIYNSRRFCQRKCNSHDIEIY